MFAEKKNLHVSVPMHFKPMLFKGQQQALSSEVFADFQWHEEVGVWSGPFCLTVCSKCHLLTLGHKDLCL